MDFHKKMTNRLAKMVGLLTIVFLTMNWPHFACKLPIHFIYCFVLYLI
jgi:hypothetical protein